MRHALGLRFVLALSWIAAAACDPDEMIGDVPPAEQVDPAKAAAEAAAKKKADEQEAAAGDFAVCMAGCIEGRAQSPTDRQTCRLTCGADRLGADGPGASAGAKAALGRFDTCLDADCTKPGSATDAATCRLTCAQAALAGEGAPALASEARGCAVSCLEQTGDCEAGCRGGPDDVATCRLQCTGLGERCLGRCEEEPEARPKLTTAVEGKAASGSETKVEPARSVPKKTLERLPAPQ